MDKGKPPAKVGATDNALPSSAPDEAGVKTKPASDQARAARAAVAIASFLNTSLSSPRAGERKVCSFFLRGCCRFGDNCRNSHKVDLVENASDFVENTVGGEVKVGRANLTEAKRGAGDEKEDLAPKEAALDEVERIQVSYVESYRALMVVLGADRAESTLVRGARIRALIFSACFFQLRRFMLLFSSRGGLYVS